jgi:serine/threonine protein kinase
MPEDGTPIVRGDQGWLILSEDATIADEIMDLFGCSGVLRGNLHDVYDHPGAQPRPLGEGAYAVVHCMMHRSSNEPTAVKLMNPNVEFPTIEREVKMLINASGNRHIIDFHGLFRIWEPDIVRLAVVTELCPCGDLLAEVLRHGPVLENHARSIFSGLLSALVHIHSMDIIHRDIKAENVLLVTLDFPMLADFGLATLIDDPVQMARRCGSPGYVAPEVCLGQQYGPKVDVFGAGVVLYFMLSKEMPFSSPDHDTAATMRRTVKCNLHLRRPPWDGMTSPLRGMLRGLICKSTDDRLSSQAAMEHAWLQLPPQQPLPTVEEAATALPGMGLLSAEILAHGYPAVHGLPPTPE